MALCVAVGLLLCSLFGVRGLTYKIVQWHKNRKYWWLCGDWRFYYNKMSHIHRLLFLYCFNVFWVARKRSRL